MSPAYVAPAKLAMEKIYEDFGVFPENTNFGIKSSTASNFIIANDVNLIKENNKEIQNFGKYIREGTLYLSCWMSEEQIKEYISTKVMFKNVKSN